KYFIAHILLELLLDKVLIAHNPDLLAEYYAHFEVAAPFDVTRAGTETVVKHDLPNYESFLQKFLDNKYLYHYEELDHIAYILKRLLRRVGIQQSAFLDAEPFDRLMQDYEARLSTRYEIFFEEIRTAESA
ncbi:MAG: hypothetical protein AAF570_26880, partial [Bacteroidota bacterium]